MVIDFIVSGWSFFFRWPLANAKIYRAAGVFLGPCLQTFVFLVFSCIAAVLLGSEVQFWAPIFGWLGLSMLTGFFHEDGLADTADSLGVSKFNSGESLDKIHSTFKDPRLGTFGVSALAVFWLFRYATVAEGKVEIATAAIVCLFSRAISLGLGLYFSPRVAHAVSPRSSHVMQNVNGRVARWILLLALVVGMSFLLFASQVLQLFGSPLLSVEIFAVNLVSALLVVLAAWTLSALVLHLLVRRTEALNGDLLGAVVCISEVFLTIGFLRIL
jgi:adenosylcobinamide-GDP ribazoletransferase